MVVEAANRERRDSILTSNSRHKGPEALLHLGRDYPGPILRAENAMHPVGDVRVRHGREDSIFNRPSGTVDSTYAFPAFRLAFRGGRRLHAGLGNNRASGAWCALKCGRQTIQPSLRDCGFYVCVPGIPPRLPGRQAAPCRAGYNRASGAFILRSGSRRGESTANGISKPRSGDCIQSGTHLAWRQGRRSRMPGS